MIDIKEPLMDKNKRGIKPVVTKVDSRMLLTRWQRIQLERTVQISKHALGQGDLDIAIECFASGVCELAKT